MSHDGPQHRVQEFPPELRPVLARAKTVARWTVAYLVSVGLVLWLVLGSSQAMKAAWLETVFSLVSPVVFLIGAAIARRPANRRWPYGFHRWVSIAFLCASFSLFALGIYLTIDAVLKIISPPRAEIGHVFLWGRDVWLGWFMLAGLAWSAVPAWFIGRLQARHARLLHDKVLSADADLRGADWMSASAAAIGVLGIEQGWNWLDPAAGCLIGLLVIRSGFRQLMHAASDLADSAPTLLDERLDPLPQHVAERLRQFDWVEEVEVRIREEGHLLFGEAVVVARSDDQLRARVAEATRAVCAMHWRIRSFVITPLPPETDPELATGRGSESGQVEARRQA